MKTITTALQLLKLIAEKPLSVKEAADALSLHMSSASRILSTMQKEGFVDLNSDRKYEIGYFVSTLAGTVTEQTKLKDIAHPFLQTLNIEVDETIHLAILDGNMIKYIDKIDSSKSIRMHSTIGAYNPVYCTGVGKAILAFQEQKVIDRIVSSFAIEQFTENTVKNKVDFIEELIRTRQTGIAHDYGEHDIQINCIAAPIFSGKERVIAGISISAPEFFTNKEIMDTFKPLLLNTSKQISQQFGYTGQIPPACRR